MTRGATRFALALALLSSLVGPALAHAHLKVSTPAANATIRAAPNAVTLTFSEGIVLKFSGLDLSDAAGKHVPLGPAVAGDSAATLTAPITGDLAPSIYTVTWHAVATDSHRTKGTFHFTLAP